MHMHRLFQLFAVFFLLTVCVTVSDGAECVRAGHSNKWNSSFVRYRHIGANFPLLMKIDYQCLSSAQFNLSANSEVATETYEERSLGIIKGWTEVVLPVIKPCKDCDHMDDWILCGKPKGECCSTYDDGSPAAAAKDNCERDRAGIWARMYVPRDLNPHIYLPWEGQLQDDLNNFIDHNYERPTNVSLGLMGCSGAPLDASVSLLAVATMLAFAFSTF
jgi:hypothetical protein